LRLDRGIALRGQKKTEAGNEMLRGALTLDEKIFGKSHSILESLGKVGRTLNDLAKYTDMEKRLREELALRTKTLGSEHTQTLQSMENLRTTLHRQDEFKMAEKVQRQLLALKSKKSGKEHPETLRQRGHLAHILACQTRYAEAEQLERETLALKDRILGAQHPDTLASVLNLAHYLDDQEQYEDALNFYKRACTGYQATLGPDHETTKKWTYIYDALKEVVDSGQLKSKSLTTTHAPFVSVVSEAKASNTTELVLRPKGWWRPDLKKWKTRKHRWFAEEESKK
jgi:tetratricopeptide (TPR) repeat protein